MGKGRPNKYFTHVQPRFAEIKEWLQAGATEKEIASRIGINQKVWCKYKNEHSEFSELVLNAIKTRSVKRKPVERSWCVYRHTFPNGKVYIGITSVDPAERWKNGKGYSKNTYVRAAIEKYGWENVKHEILFTDLPEEEAKLTEIELIKKYQANHSEHGYNLTEGGEGCVLTPEQRRYQRLKKEHFGEITFAQNITDVLARLNTVEKLSKEGFTKLEIANMFGVSRTTWYMWEKEEPIILETIDSGRISAVKEIKAALYKRATGFNYTEKKTVRKQILLKDEDDEDVPATMVQEEESIKYALPDPASAMILLKHWDKDDEGHAKWTQDPAQLELKKAELEYKKEHMESGEW